MRFKVATSVDQPLERVLPVFGDPALVASVVPGFMHVEVLKIGLDVGDELHARMRVAGREVEWISRIVSRDDSEGAVWFVDRNEDTLPWPLTHWEHHHGFVRRASGTTIIDAPRFEVRPRVLAPLLYVLLYVSFLARRRTYRRHVDGR